MCTPAGHHCPGKSHFSWSTGGAQESAFRSSQPVNVRCSQVWEPLVQAIILPSLNVYTHIHLLIRFCVIFQLPGFTHISFPVPFRLHYWFFGPCAFQALPAFWPPAPKNPQLLTEPVSGGLRGIQA